MSWGDSGCPLVATHLALPSVRVVWSACPIVLWKMTWEAAMKLVMSTQVHVLSALEILRELISSKTARFQGSYKVTYD